MKKTIKKVFMVLLSLPLLSCLANPNKEIDNKIEFQKGETMKISVQAKGETAVFKLNNSQAAKELYEQLPLEIEVENFGNNEKIFYPPKKLSTNNTPLAKAKNGTLAYYAPWGDVVMFYKDFGSAGGLYELGEIISGLEYIKNMSGIIKINKEE
ncbi:cyclophilin-like fold protein [Halarcobacter anaerophilus]|uniref:cyclophilin-like fold protein n=1 Tax=Halarcobacter anaerophilus TaxID=877500 RepID=UPI0005C97A5D|nr:cyclophilin-like fold protein [Halarcobacter anaerophilus]